VHPVITSPIPRPAGVIATPIIAETECHDADAELRSILDHGNAAALVIVVQVVAVYPAAIAFPIDIAPGPIVDTTVQIHQSVGRDGGDERIVGTRSGSKMHMALGVGVGCPRGRSIADDQEAREH
jgi:hypothetical protein